MKATPRSSSHHDSRTPSRAGSSPVFVEPPHTPIRPHSLAQSLQDLPVEPQTAADESETEPLPEPPDQTDHDAGTDENMSRADAVEKVNVWLQSILDSNGCLPENMRHPEEAKSIVDKLTEAQLDRRDRASHQELLTSVLNQVLLDGDCVDRGPNATLRWTICPELMATVVRVLTAYDEATYEMISLENPPIQWHWSKLADQDIVGSLSGAGSMRELIMFFTVFQMFARHAEETIALRYELHHGGQILPPTKTRQSVSPIVTPLPPPISSRSSFGNPNFQLPEDGLGPTPRKHQAQDRNTPAAQASSTRQTPIKKELSVPPSIGTSLLFPSNRSRSISGQQRTASQPVQPPTRVSSMQRRTQFLAPSGHPSDGGDSSQGDEDRRPHSDPSWGAARRRPPRRADRESRRNQGDNPIPQPAGNGGAPPPPPPPPPAGSAADTAGKEPNKQTFILQQAPRDNSLRLDTRIPRDHIPTWDGSKKAILKYLHQMCHLAKKGTAIAEDLGRIAPFHWTGTAADWWLLLDDDLQQQYSSSWWELMEGI
ncbi:hypothetical protein BV25DRAFT_1919588 [Artomyces pyxidatus]|uniref:Uncharacterized protein n=1 Tax=Artomyces pyxidatus TaxID=48021 RepID=A0ACB8SNH5_9AGAM|nr:hypothetical protein BV25DRAFT_1919588 [Artomyces pyxidatus]